ncbi:hypothetical protein C0993_005226 [Termitomyces sp. T159_Od127]|nr:hypothetical protein C0993_005226 [Termitomyces sp. T159_Od127]
MDQPLLVAPRPMRLAGTRAQPHAVDRTRADAARDEFKLADKDAASPRSSPRSASFAALPSEALEEFLSILRPAIFPPLSPVSRRPAPSLPTYPHERALAFHGRLLADLVPDDIDAARSQQPSRNCLTPDSITEDEATVHIDPDHSPVRWYKSNVLCKPPLFPDTRSLLTSRPSLSHLTHTYPQSFPPPCLQPISNNDIPCRDPPSTANS